MRQVIAIGGGGFGRTVKSKLIEKYILDQSPINKPKVCFVPTATGDSEAYIENFYHVFSKLCCVPSHISFFKRTMDLKLHIEKQDIVFVGGGNTKSMLAVWREWGLDKLLEDGRIISDLKKRKEIYQDFQKFLVEDTPAIFLSHPTTYTITRK